jgi:hypothetical protein
MGLNTMDGTAITPLAGLVGAAIGGLATALASWLSNRKHARAQWLSHDIVRRQDLYKEFIEATSKCYVHALQHAEPDIPAMVDFYAKIGRMRVLSSPEVLKTAEAIQRIIVDTYLAPDKSLVEVRDMINRGAVDPLREFSTACRAELQAVRGQRF